jgi:hypothetical protein
MRGVQLTGETVKIGFKDILTDVYEQFNNNVPQACQLWRQPRLQVAAEQVGLRRVKRTRTASVSRWQACSERPDENAFKKGQTCRDPLTSGHF